MRRQLLESIKLGNDGWKSAWDSNLVMDISGSEVEIWINSVIEFTQWLLAFSIVIDDAKSEGGEKKRELPPLFSHSLLYWLQN